MTIFTVIPTWSELMLAQLSALVRNSSSTSSAQSLLSMLQLLSL